MTERLTIYNNDVIMYLTNEIQIEIKTHNDSHKNEKLFNKG